MNVGSSNPRDQKNDFPTSPQGHQGVKLDLFYTSTESKQKLSFSDPPTSAYVIYEWSLIRNLFDCINLEDIY